MKNITDIKDIENIADKAESYSDIKKGMGGYVKLGELKVYRASLELSALGWEIYESLHWRDKKITGDQFIEATDSHAANIAEGYGRYHYLDRIKFYYNARARRFLKRDIGHFSYITEGRFLELHGNCF